MSDIEETEAVQLTGWMRSLAIISGIISIIAAVFVIINPLIAVRTLVLIFAVALLFIGIERLIARDFRKILQAHGS